MSDVRMRATLDSIAAYKPGKRPAAGQVAARLASNETPFPPLPSVVEAVAAAAAEAHRYPDPTATRMVEAIAAHYALPESQVSVGCGSVALVQQLLSVTVDAGDEVVYAWRSFEAYPVLTALAGGAAVQVPLRDAHLDLDAMRDAITDRTRLVLLCSPNNPTGPALARDDVARFLSEVPEHVLVVCDEAYYEFVTDSSAVDGVPMLPEHPNLAVLRTFSKAYGLAGLRAGYCLASPEVTEAMRKVQLPFSVNAVAQAAAIASLAARDELARRVATVVAERERVGPALRELGFDVPPSQGNFVWLALGDLAVPVSEVLEEQGVLARTFAGDGIRVTVTEPGETERLLAAAEKAATLLP
jgi:histidinol-phosphate aminotransferase